MLCYEFISHSFWQAKQAYRSHSFPCMNRDQRRLIHELGECYGCETQSYDYEPSKNVVATAHKYAVFLLYTGKGPHMIFMHVTFCLKIVRKFCVKITLRFLHEIHACYFSSLSHAKNSHELHANFI